MQFTYDICNSHYSTLLQSEDNFMQLDTEKWNCFRATHGWEGDQHKLRDEIDFLRKEQVHMMPTSTSSPVGQLMFTYCWCRISFHGLIIRALAK